MSNVLHIEFRSTGQMAVAPGIRATAHPVMLSISKKLTAPARRRVDELLRDAFREGWTVADTARAIAGLGIERRSANLIARTGLSALAHSR